MNIYCRFFRVLRMVFFNALFNTFLFFLEFNRLILDFATLRDL